MQRGMSGAFKWLPRDDADPLYDPFRRFDQYGTMGVTPQPWWEYLRLGLLAVTLLPLKFVGTLGAWLPRSFCRRSPCWLAPRYLHKTVLQHFFCAAGT